MFPNPQDALPLPSRPNLEKYRKLAKELVKACKSDATGAWVKRWLGSANRQVEEFARRRLSETCSLTGAQFVIARSHGFESWVKFSKHVESLAENRFETAVDAIVKGDAARLKQLLRENPKLARARSGREHGATLLHYVSANGVEGYRQKTPPNIVEIAEILLDAGAEIDAEADVYGGGCTALGLAATSVWPEKAGVQETLLETLLARGASMEKQSAGNRHSLVAACLANGRPKAAAFLAGRGARVNFVEAAGLGLIEVVARLVGKATDKQKSHALCSACVYGRKEVAALLIRNGADLRAVQGDGQTPLHMAAIGGQVEIVKLLLKHDPALEAVNQYGGTVLGQTLWSAAHGGNPDVYIEILEALAAAGAKIPERHVPVNARIDAWLAERGSVAEPRWWWFGEEPGD